jgi:ATP-dependent DNA helicase RecQ
MYTDRFTHEFFITNAHPGRSLVEQTWAVLRGASDARGLVTLPEAEIARRLPATLGGRNVGAALRVLAAAGVLTIEAPRSALVWVRLLAGPDRIVRELADDRALDRHVLRALWRSVGQRLEAGAVVDLDALPRALGGAMAVTPVLARLEAAQFVAWKRVGGGIRLDVRSNAASWLPVDWSQLAHRRQVEWGRLDAMQQYAQTRYCRRAFVLRYFGDPEVRSHCGACDRCMTSEALPAEPIADRIRLRVRRS